MVERLSRISRSDASAPADVAHTLNIGSDAENAWVAARQSQISDDIEERRRQALEDGARAGASGSPEDETEEPRLSGESERIGTQNFDEDTPFGARVAIV